MTENNLVQRPHPIKSSQKAPERMQATPEESGPPGGTVSEVEAGPSSTTPREDEATSVSASDEQEQTTEYTIFMAVGYSSPDISHFKLKSCNFKYFGADCTSTDADVFKALRAEALKAIGPSILRRLFRPCRLAKVEYGEFWYQNEEGPSIQDEGKLVFPQEDDKTHDGSFNSAGCRIKRGWEPITQTDLQIAKLCFAKQPLTWRIRHPETVGGGVFYGKSINRVLASYKLDPGHRHMWGLIVYQEFDQVSCRIVVFTMSLLIALAIVLPLTINGPLKGNVPGIIGIISGIIGVTNLCVIMTYDPWAKREGLLP
ncbi:unnamed protein product [Clonostachys rosea]|uniref:Uncharacterized protein n=1 Tax=Bionectria ochroleuca TaxID=29856 RepID=A0ABY6ULY2_BIOOC|nr:unnamed protein product [Clonostachys rosea]